MRIGYYVYSYSLNSVTHNSQYQNFALYLLFLFILVYFLKRNAVDD